MLFYFLFLAAHCFDRGASGRIAAAYEYTVAAGKIFRTWDSIEDSEQKFGVC